MSAANTFKRIYLVLACGFMIAFPILYLLSEAEKDSQQAKTKVPPPADTKTEAKAEVKEKAPPERPTYTRPEWDRGTKVQPEEKQEAKAAPAIVPTPDEGYATQAFNWLKSPHSFYGWLRMLEIMLVPGMIELALILVDITKSKLKRGGEG